MNGWVYLTYFAIFIALVVLIPPLVKRYYYQRMMNDLEKGNYAAYLRHLDSLMAKLSFSAFERESMRLSFYKSQGEKTKVEEQLAFMENMRLSRKQKAQLGEQGFYIYLDMGKIKKAKRMLDLVEANGSPQQFHNLEMQYSILLKKEAKYIDELKERHAKMKESGAIGEGVNIPAGMLEYLIGLQYSYKGDKASMKEWLIPAKSHLAGTIDAQTVDELLKTVR